MAWSTASHGSGKSKKIASASLLIPNPSPHTSRYRGTTRGSVNPFISNSSLAFWARTSLNSKVRTDPRGMTQRAMAVVMAPLPVPASMTTLPSHNESWKQMTAWSLVWTICVL